MTELNGYRPSASPTPPPSGDKSLDDLLKRANDVTFLAAKASAPATTPGLSELESLSQVGQAAPPAADARNIDAVLKQQTDHLKQALEMMKQQGGLSSSSVTGNSHGSQGGIRIDKLMTAIFGKESNNNHQAINPDSGAIGFGQVMPDNVGPWTKEALGYEMTPAAFAKDPDAQRKVIAFKLKQYVKQRQDAGEIDEGKIVRQVASMWYSGQANLYDDGKTQSYGAGEYPSIRSYTTDILDRYQTA